MTTFRVKLRVKRFKNPLNSPVSPYASAARRSASFYAPVPDKCPKCGLSFVDPLGRPVSLGYVCGQTGCPTGMGSFSSIQNYPSATAIARWRDEASARGQTLAPL